MSAEKLKRIEWKVLFQLTSDTGSWWHKTDCGIYQQWKILLYAVHCPPDELINQSDTLWWVEISFWITANTSRCSEIHRSYCSTSQYLGNMHSSCCSCGMPLLVCSKARALCVTELASLCMNPRGSCLTWEKCKCNCSGQNSPFGPQRWKRYRSCFR